MKKVKVKASFSEKLTELDKVLTAIKEKMHDEHYEIENKLKPKVKKLDLENKKGHGYCFRVSKSVSL